MEEVNVEVVRREVIKPASPSPHDRLQLSILDIQLCGLYVPTIFFYKVEDLLNMSSPEIISRNLKSSLSETLSRFYPLAGRREGASINCNDEGAVFIEARTDVLLHDFLRNINTDSLERFFPSLAPEDSAADWPLLNVRVTFFGSGSGVAVSVAVTHMICDAASALTFVTDWANTTAKRQRKDTITFAETTIYPPPPPPPLPESLLESVLGTGKCVTKRFVFESSKIAELKLKAASESVPVPSRVEVITALVWRCATKASRSNLEVPRSIMMCQAMDLRLRIPSTVLPRETVGNLQTAFFLKNSAESDLKISETVASFRKSKEEITKIIQENIQGDELGEHLLSVVGNSLSELQPDVDFFSVASWCKMPFYEVDFGWGSPVWTGYTPDHENLVYLQLIDSKDGEGVEAWIGLPEQDMPVFLRDQELLAYAILNPPVPI